MQSNLKSEPKTESSEPGVLLTHENVKSLFLKKVCALTPSHKGQRGHLVVIGGSKDTPGAPILTARAGFRAGAGLVTLISDPEVSKIALVNLSELMSADVDAYLNSGIPLRDHLNREISAAVVGPGLSYGERVVLESLRQFSKNLTPVVVDASALRYLAKIQSLKTFLVRNCVLTPHPGELSQLLDVSTDEIQKDRKKWAREASEMFSSVVVLKGPQTVIANPQGKTFVSPWSNANLATAGSGDVLAGLIGGLMARGVSMIDSSIIAVFLHGWSGTILQPEGIVGSLASEFAEDFPRRSAELIKP